MVHKQFFQFLACATLLLSLVIMASAQTAPLEGRVIMKNADGTTTPVVGAIIDVFRTDISAKYETKTGKKGDFVFAGVPLVGRYVIAASKAGARPNFLGGVRPGQGIDFEIELYPDGDGKRLTLAEISAMGTGATASRSKPTAEEAAKQAEIMKQNAEIASSNKRAESSNAIIERTFKAGNEAYRANNHDAAIAAFNEGIAADPEHPGIPSLLTNKAAALRARGVDRYNSAVKLTDDAAKSAGIESSRKDWREAAEAASRAVTLLKAAPASSGPDAATAKQALYIALLGRAEGMRLFVVKVDQSKVEDGVAAYQEYIAAEVDAAKKTKAQNDLAQMLFDANAFDKALVEYRKILETNPDDLNAILRAGQSLFNIGAINNSDKAMYQEAANYLGQFIAKAPDSDPFKADAKAILEALKDQANVKPEKVATPARRTRRP